MHAVFATGAYQTSYNADGAQAAAVGKGAGSRPLGLVEDLVHWRRTLHGQAISGSMAAGLPLGRLYTGAEFYLRLTLKEWNPTVLALLFPWSADLGQVGPVGQPLGHWAGELLLTARPGTLAADAGPANLRFAKVCPAADAPLEIPLGPVPRDITVTLQCLPYVGTDGTWRWFETE